MNWQRAFDDISTIGAGRMAAFAKLGPRARRRLKREGVLGAGALAAMIAAANASQGADEAQLAAADADAVDSLDDILSFAAVCATGDGASAGAGAFHALHGGADGHEAHAFFEAAFASRFDSALCGGSEGAHEGHGARTASKVHEAHTDDHGAAAMLASAHAGHGEAAPASGDHAAHGAEPDHERTGGEEHAHEAAPQPFATVHAGHGGDASSAQGAAAQPHDAHDAYDPYVLNALAGAQQNGADSDGGDLSAGLDALLGQARNDQNDAEEPAAVAQAQTASHGAHAYVEQDYAAQDLPPATAEV